jgi:hypothetical protein
MNRRFALIVVFLAGIAAGGVAVPHVLPQPAVAQGDAAEVVLVSPDDDAIWMPGPPAATFYLFKGGAVVAEDADGEQAEYLDAKTAREAFAAALTQLRKE